MLLSNYVINRILMYICRKFQNEKIYEIITKICKIFTYIKYLKYRTFSKGKNNFLPMSFF